MTSGAQIVEVRKRIGLIRRAFASGMRTAVPASQPAGVVHVEIDGTAYDLPTIAGVPQDIVARQDPADWALIVDDWSLIVPIHPPRAIDSQENCAIRIGDELWPQPMNFEIAHWTPDYFVERVPNALLYYYVEGHGAPTGSLALYCLLDAGLPRYLGSVPDPPPDRPKLAMGTAWPTYYEYRRGRRHQLSLTENAWIDGNWKDLLVLHGLFDAEGFGRVYSEYPELPAPLMDYCRVLAEAAKLPEAMPPKPPETDVSTQLAGNDTEI